MSTTTDVSADDLRAQIAAHEQQIAVAEREIGVAILAGKSTAGPTKRATEARAAIRGLEAALEELERREAEQAKETRRRRRPRDGDSPTTGRRGTSGWPPRRCGPSPLSRRRKRL